MPTTILIYLPTVLLTPDVVAIVELDADDNPTAIELHARLLLSIERWLTRNPIGRTLAQRIRAPFSVGDVFNALAANADLLPSIKPYLSSQELADMRLSLTGANLFDFDQLITK